MSTAPEIVEMGGQAEVCQVGNSVGYLDVEIRDFLSCPWCGESLPQSTTKPFKYCSEAHEKRFKRAGGISKKQSDELKQLAIDYWLATFNRDRAFSTFSRHDPFTNLPTFSKKRRKEHKQQFSRCLQCGKEFEQLSGFAFCGETLLVAGECKMKWLASVNDSVSKPAGPVPEPPFGRKKPSRAERARILVERKDYLPRPRTK